MPQITVTYTFEWSATPKRPIGSICFISASELFRAISTLGLSPNKPFDPSEDYVIYQIKADETDSIHARVWDLFRKHGIDLDRVTGFHPFRSRHYEKHEYDHFDFVSLRPDKLAWIAEFAENRNGVHILKANSRLKNKLVFGNVEHTRVFYASQEGREHLDRQNLIGIAWDPVVFDQPEKAAKQLFGLRSSITMPKCLTRIVDTRGTDVATLAESEIVVRQWDNGEHFPAEMSFRRSEVEALGKFDVALPQEVVGGFPRWYHPEVIVSQRFRQVLLKMKNTSVGFNPVHLV